MSQQPGLFDRPAPYVRGSETSKAAAQSIDSTSLRAVVFAYLLAQGARGATGDEIEAGTGLKHQTVGPRILELREAGHVVDAGTRRPTRSGRKATVWRAAGIAT